MAQPLEYEQIGGNPDGGSIFGQTSTDKVGFYGSVPVTRPVTASTNNVSTVTGISTSSVGVAITTWGFATQVALTNAITAVSTMMTTMKNLGLMAGGVQTEVTASSALWRVLDYGSPDGAQFGRISTELLGFYGATPTARITVSTADISTATTVSASTNGDATTTWGFRTSSELNMYCSAISTMQLSMKRLGLMV